jgi:hypothetical protein
MTENFSHNLENLFSIGKPGRKEHYSEREHAASRGFRRRIA